MNSLLTAILSRFLIGMGKKLNEKEYHDFALKLKLKDIEKGYKSYENDKDVIAYRADVESKRRLSESDPATLRPGGDH